MAEIKSNDLKLLSKNVRQQHQNQLSKLTYKAEAELEFLDVIREYMKGRAEMEQQHSKNLEKLSKTLAQRKLKKYLGYNPMPFAKDEQSAQPARSTYQSFAALLQETEVKSRKQAEVAEAIIRDISAVIKDFSKHKLISIQKNVEFSGKYQQEIWNAYDETEKCRVLYEKASKEADAAVRKYDEALKKPKSGLQSLKTLVTGKDAATVVQKLKTKSKQKSRELNEARNEYLLSLQGLNSIQQLYDTEDLTILMQKLDGQYYTTLQNLFGLFAKLEDDVSNQSKASVELLKNQFALISRSKEMDSFLDEHPAIFKANNIIPFETIGTDTTKDLVVDEITKISLGQHLGLLVTQDSMLQVFQATKEAELKGAKGLVDVYLQSPTYGNTASPLELVQDVQNALDLIKCQRVKLGSQITALKKLDVVAIMPPKPEDQQENMIRNGIQFATVLYTYNTEKEDELKVNEGDEVEIITGEKDGWVKAKSVKTGEVGLLPATYVKIPVSNQNNKTVVALYDYAATEEGELSFKAGDEILCLDGVDADEEWWEGKNARTNEEGVFAVLFVKGWESVALNWAKEVPTLARAASVNSKKSALAQKRASMSPSKTPSILSPSQSDCQMMSPMGTIATIPEVVEKAKALYKYEATCDGELTIEEGEIVVILSKNTGNDQWWEGQGKNGKGQFPSSYVRIMDGNTSTTAIKVKALYDYEPMSPGDLSFKAGDIVTILSKADQDWWDGELNGHQGTVPANYVEIL